MTESNENALYKDLLRLYFDNSKDGVFVVCGSQHFCAANRELQRWLGVDGTDLGNDQDTAIISGFIKAQDDRDLFLEHLDHALAGESRHFECQIHPTSGEARWLEISMSRVVVDHGEFVIGIARDVTERRTLQAQLEYQALHDELTGLPNRRSFMLQLERLLDDAKNNGAVHTLIYLDLDHFKVINDTSGHHVGDQYLQRVSDLVKRSLGIADVLARIGGDEFGILLRNSTPEQSKPFVEKIRAVIAEHPFHWEQKVFKVSASIGYTAISPERGSTSELMSFADAACYVAKDMGRNSMMEYFGGTRCTGKRQEMDWVTRINEALEQDDFLLYFQNIEAFAVGARPHREVLLRLQDSDGCIIAPGAFLPAAERYGLMPYIDRWVVRAVFDMLRQGAVDSSRAIWTVNLSGASIGDASFVYDLCHWLVDPDIPSEQICFEITETMAITNMANAQEFMRRVRGLGCKVALDDFGSGMSSFAYLKNLPVDYVKIDGSLIVNVENSSTDRSIVESVNHISHTLGFQTIAEFVENDAIYECLQSIGVDYVQGYGVHRPEPIEMRDDSPYVQARQDLPCESGPVTE